VALDSRADCHFRPSAVLLTGVQCGCYGDYHCGGSCYLMSCTACL